MAPSVPIWKPLILNGLTKPGKAALLAEMHHPAASRAAAAIWADA
jgi:hypothetical protein